MTIEVSENIKSPKQDVWKTIVDIENAEKSIPAILKVEVLERPTNGLVGLKWRETRKMFGKEATETMWITCAEENHWYETQAFSSGCEYNTRITVEETSDGTKLSMRLETIPKTLIARLMSPLGFLFSGAIKKNLQQDLSEIKQSLEN